MIASVSNHPKNQNAFPIIHIIGNALWLDVPVADRTFKVFMLGILDREKSHLGPSGTDCAGSTPSTGACSAGPQRPAPEGASAVPAPAAAGLSQSCTRDRPRACLEASSHTTIQDSRTIFEHAVGLRTIFDPGCFRCRYLATAEEQAQLSCLLQFINHLAPNSARTNVDPGSHDLRSPTSSPGD